MMRMLRQIVIAAALVAGCVTASAAEGDVEALVAQPADDVPAQRAAVSASPEAPAVPYLREVVRVTSDLVRIGDLVDNAGALAQVAVYRSPDLGTTGTLTTSEVLATLRANQVFGVDTHGIGEVVVTRLARSLTARDIEQKVAHALERRYGLGAAASITVTFDRELGTLQLDPSNTGDMRVASTRYDARNGRFDILFEILNSEQVTPTRLRFTGTAVETVEVAVLTRSVEANEVLKSSDVVTERRTKVEVGNDPASRDKAVGKQAHRALRAGQALRAADLGNPDLVQRDQNVTLVYDSGGLYLTIRAKALESGTAGDTVSVLNPQSKRTVQGIVTGPAQVSVLAASPITTAAVTDTSSRQQP